MKKILFALLVTLFLVVSCVPESPETEEGAPAADEEEEERKIAPTAPKEISPGQILHLGMYTDQSRNLWVINSDGTGLKKVLSRYTDAKWSPDNNKILYQFSTKLFIMNPDASGKKEIVSAHDTLGMYDWSSDGKYVLFEEGKNIGIVNMETYEEKMPIVDAKSPAYPEKDRIAFISGKNIYKADIMTGENVEEWLELKDPKALQASPDGLYLSFNNDGAFWVALDKKDTDELTKVADGIVLNYAWSPDSKKIVYKLTSGKFHIYDLNTKIKKTVDKDSKDRFTWSPDSKWIAFTYKAPQTYEDIWFVKADGTNLQKFTDCSTACEMPDWSN